MSYVYHSLVGVKAFATIAQTVFICIVIIQPFIFYLEGDKEVAWANSCPTALNQACAGILKGRCACFLDTAFVQEVSMCMCMCVCLFLPPKLLTSGVMWHDIDRLNKFYNFYVVAVVGNISRHGHII